MALRKMAHVCEQDLEEYMDQQGIGASASPERKRAHEKNVGIVIGHARSGRLHEVLHGSGVHKLMRLASDVEVHVVSDREHERGHPR
jgi:hypothetical protein